MFYFLIGISTAIIARFAIVSLTHSLEPAIVLSEFAVALQSCRSSQPVRSEHWIIAASNRHRTSLPVSRESSDPLGHCLDR